MTDFAIRNLSVLSYAQGFTSWHYKAASAPLADILAPGFFSPTADMFEKGDMVIISANDGGAHVFVSSVNKIDSVVVVMPMARTAIGEMAG